MAASAEIFAGMRSSSQILIFVDVQKALDAGIKFYISANGVVLTDGDERGFLDPRFFSRVETADGKPLQGWDGPRTSLQDPPVQRSVAASTPGPSPNTASVGVGPSKQEEAVQASTSTAIDVGVQALEKKMENTTL